jgi:hypothetical protein
LCREPKGYVIDAGHRRVRQAIAAGLEEIAVLVVDRTEDGGAMRSLAETLAHEPLNPVDQWRAIERLVALGWTEEAMASRWRSPSAKSASFAFLPMFCRRCSTRWPKATCRRSVSSA